MRIYDKIGMFIVVLLNEIQLLRKHNRIGCVGGGRICPYPNLGLWHGQKNSLIFGFSKCNRNYMCACRVRLHSQQSSKAILTRSFFV